MATACLAFGGNLGDPAAQIAEALDRLDALDAVSVTARSPLFVTAAWGKTDQPDFTNAAALVATSLFPHALLDVCLGIERDMGRVRGDVWGPRLIDIDIITYDRLKLRSGRLTLPHPHAHRRDFVLKPLRAVAPEIADWLVSEAQALQTGGLG